MKIVLKILADIYLIFTVITIYRICNEKEKTRQGKKCRRVTLMKKHDKCKTCICYNCNTKDCIKKKWCEMKPCTYRHNEKCTGHGEHSQEPKRLTNCISNLFKKKERIKHNESK